MCPSVNRTRSAPVSSVVRDCRIVIPPPTTSNSSDDFSQIPSQASIGERSNARFAPSIASNAVTKSDSNP